MTNAEIWVPLVAALGGAAIGGAISIVGQHLSAKHHANVQRSAWVEERARWASENELREFRQLFDEIESLKRAVSSFRVRIAREKFSEERGEEIHQFMSANDARAGFENHTWAIQRSLMLLDEASAEWAKKFTACYDDWYLALDSGDSVEALLKFEQSIEEFRDYVSTRYRTAVQNRKNPAS